MKEEIKKELTDLASTIPPKKEVSPPEGYFEKFPDHILGRWKEEESKPRPRRLTIIRWIAIAAVSAGVIIGGWRWNSRQHDPQIPAYSSAEAYQYIMENINEFSSLMEQEGQWPNEQKITAPDSNTVEEYLLEELQDKDLEQLF